MLRTFKLALAAIVALNISASLASAAKPPKNPPPPPPIDYEIKWLIAPDGVSDTLATSSNSSGIVVGHYGRSDNQNSSRACLWTSAGVIALHDLASIPAGWVLITARGVNEFGQIAGTAVRLSDNLRRVYRYDPPTDSSPARVELMGDLQSTASHSIVYGRPINNWGDVGYSMLDANGTTVSYVQTVEGQSYQLAAGVRFNSISDARQLIGGSYRWSISTGQLESFSSAITGTDINFSGHFAGSIDTKGRSTTAIRYSTTAQSIGPSGSFAFGINSSGDVVGYVSKTGVGFVFTDAHGYLDLDTLVLNSNPIDLELWMSAYSIQPMKITDHTNGDFGIIAGSAYFNNDTYLGFLLTPKPKP